MGSRSVLILKAFDLAGVRLFANLKQQMGGCLFQCRAGLGEPGSPERVNWIR
jgi:hypothetical protein